MKQNLLWNPFEQLLYVNGWKRTLNIKAFKCGKELKNLYEYKSLMRTIFLVFPFSTFGFSTILKALETHTCRVKRDVGLRHGSEDFFSSCPKLLKD